MPSRNVISWLFRILLGCLFFCIVWFGLPWLLKLGDLTWPVPIILLLACLAFLATLSHYWWGKSVVVACLPITSLVLIGVAALFAPLVL